MPGSNGAWRLNPPPPNGSPVEHLRHRRQLREAAATTGPAQEPSPAAEAAVAQLSGGEVPEHSQSSSNGLEALREKSSAQSAASVVAWHWHTSHMAARAARVKLNDVGGLAWPLECEDMPDAQPQKLLSDPYIDNYIASQQLHYGLKPLMIVTRTDNSNVVMYACNMTEPGQVVEQPIDCFWYDVEPKTTEALRKKGHRSTRTEFGSFDNLGYGLKVSQDKDQVTAVMTAMPSELKQKFQLVWVEGEPRFLGKINGIECYMEKLYIETKKR